MSMKKGIITISTIAVVILGVFFAARFIGTGSDTANVKSSDDSIVRSNNSIIEDNNESLANEKDVSNLSVSEVPKEVVNSQGESSNQLDEAYINDKTNVGIYTVKKEDTVFSIVSTHMPSYDVNKIVQFIKTRNKMDKSYKIVEGDKIIIPYEKAIQTSTSAVLDTKTNEYVIKKQDTLTSIAKNSMPTYGVKEAIKMLKETNKITDENAIKEGMLIHIPKK